MSKNCDVTAIFLIFGQIGAVQIPDSGHRVCKSYVFSDSNLFSYKIENRTKTSQTQLSHYYFE